MWIKTEPISVPAHADTTTEVAINEWFQANRSFLLGTPVTNQLRAAAGGWAQTMAVAPEPGQDTIALLHDRLQTLLKRAKVDVKDCLIKIKTREKSKGVWTYVDTEIAAIAFNNVLAIHKAYKLEEEKYCITQISSGLGFGDNFLFPSLEAAKQCTLALLDLPIDWAAVKEVPDAHKSEIIHILTTYKSLKQDGGATSPPSDAIANDTEEQLSQGDTNMATVIPADKFESNSPFAFILRENPKASGVEIHFPPDATPDPSFIARISASGFLQAHRNPSLWYHKQYSPELMQKARGWVKTCQRFGAYEISPDEPVEQTKSRRRGKSNGSKSTPAPEQPTTPAPGGNKLVDAVCDRVQQMLDAMKAELAVKPDTSELEALKAENERLRQLLQDAEVQQSQRKQELMQEAEAERSKRKQVEEERDRMQELINQQREAINVAMAEIERLGEAVESRDRTIESLQNQLAEWGVEPVEPSAPVFEDDEPAAPVFEDEPPVFDDEPVEAPNFDDVDEAEELGESPSNSSSEVEPDDTDESAGFDLDSLGEI